MIPSTPPRSIFTDILPIWTSTQNDLKCVFRWSRFIEKNPLLRKQSVLDHQYSVLSVIDIVLSLLKTYNPDLNELLLLRAFKVHDQPEAMYVLNGYDCLADKKTQEKDIEEYLFFKKNYIHLPAISYVVQEYAYLLQYALKLNDLFPVEAIEIMDKIKKDNVLEARIFEALESWEYLFYAYECYLYHNDEYIFTQVIRRELSVLQKHAVIIPGFRQEIFRGDFEDYLKKFLEDHKDVPVD